MSYSISNDGKILTDVNVHLSDFADYKLCKCNNCNRLLEGLFICSFCHFKNKERTLFLTDYYKGREIWAYNEQHLDYLIAFVRAEVRIQRNRYTHSLFTILPSIYKSKKDKEKMLKILNQMKSRFIITGR